MFTFAIKRKPCPFYLKFRLIFYIIALINEQENFSSHFCLSRDDFYGGLYYFKYIYVYVTTDYLYIEVQAFIYIVALGWKFSTEDSQDIMRKEMLQSKF